MDMNITDAEKALGYRSESHLMKDWADANAIYNIEISLRRIANAMENEKKMDKQFVELSKAKDEIVRLKRELADTREDLAKTEGKAAFFEKEHDKIRQLLQPVAQCEGMGCTRGYERGYCPAVDAVRDVQNALQQKGERK